MNKQLLKYEFNYTSPFWISLAVLLLTFTGFSLFDFQILSGPAFEIDYWGAIYTMFLYMLLYIMWVQKIKEKRLRIHALLPITQKSIAKSRVGFLGIPMSIILFYIIVIHLVLLTNWRDESSSLLGQSGLFFVIVNASILGRDLWISNTTKNIFHRTLPIAILTILILSIGAGIVLILPTLYNSVPDNWGRITFLYSKVIFFIMAFTILLILIPVYAKRRSYFS